MPKVIFTPNAPAPIGPYSQAIVSGQTLFISGQICLHPVSNELMNADLETETFQVMNNLKAILIEAGIEFNQVIKSSIFLKDMNDFAQVNTIYASFFDGYYPARETVEVSCLPRNVRVEISMIAELK